MSLYLCKNASFDPVTQLRPHSVCVNTTPTAELEACGAEGRLFWPEVESVGSGCSAGGAGISGSRAAVMKREAML